MSCANINIIMGRIQVAAEDSPIAVFHVNGGDSEKLDAFFANTIFSQQRISVKDPLFVGVFDRSMDSVQIRSKLDANVATKPIAA